MDHFYKEKHNNLSRQYTGQGTVSWGPPFPYSDYIRRMKEYEFQKKERYLRYQIAIRQGTSIDPMTSSRMIRDLENYRRQRHERE